MTIVLDKVNYPGTQS